MNTVTTTKILKPTKIFFAAVFVFLMGSVGSVSGATYTVTQNGNWSNNATWGGGGHPVAGDIVNIAAGHNVTVTADAACSSITFTGNGGTLTINSTFTLAVSGAVTLNSADASYSNIITGAGSLTCASLTVGTTVNLNRNDRTTTLTTSIATLTISGNLSLYSDYDSNQSNDAIFYLSTGTVIVNGSITSNNVNGNNTSTLSMATGTQDGILILGGATPFALSGTGTNTITLNGTSTTVNYNRSGTQTVYATTYNNLTLSGSGTKTLTGVSTINGDLTFSGSANATAATGLTIGGDVVLGSGTTFNGSTYTHSIAGSWTNNGGTFTANSCTINLNGSIATNINGSAPTSFYNLTINKGAAATTVTSTSKAFTVSNVLTVTRGNLILQATDANYSVGGDLTVSTNGTLTHSVNWDTDGKLLQVGGNIAIDGNYNYSTVSRSHVQMTGSGKTIHTGTSALSILTLLTNGTITANGTVTVNDNFWAFFITAGGTFATNGYTVTAKASLINAGGTININGGTLNITGGLQVGSNGVNGNVNFSTGTLNADNITVGVGTTGAFNHSGGTANISGDLTISTTGTYTCSNSPVINVGGNWTNNGTFTPGTGTVNFNDNAAQTIGGSSSTTFYNLIIANTATAPNNTVTLNKPTSVSGVLTLTSGLLVTTSNLLSVTNTAKTAIVGGSTTSFINGPVNWTLPTLATGSTYTFPVGSGTTYLPFALVNPVTSGASSAQVQAFTASSGGTADGTTISSISNTEYWQLTTGSNFTSSSVSLTRQTAIAPLDAIGGSTTQGGTYTNLDGTPGIYGVTGSTAIGSNKFFALAAKNQTLNIGTIIGSVFCAGSSISIPYTITGTFTAGNIFKAQLSNATGSFASPVDIGTLTSTSSGSISGTIPALTAPGTGYRIRVVSNNPALTSTANGIALTISAISTALTTTGGTICIGSTAVLSASGAVTGEKYKWYDAVTGGNLLKTSTDNTDNTYTTAVLAATTNYWVSILNAGGCESPRIQVTATFPALSSDNQSLAGTDSWIGHVYDGTNNGVAYNGNFTNYYGHYTEAETFDESFGGDATCFGIISNSTTRSIYTETFSVRYRMNSSRDGLYVVNLGSDDGNRLTIDGALIYADWGDHGVNDHPNVLMNLTGTSSLLYDYYENGGGNRVYFQNITQVLANNLTTNTTQNVYVGSTAAAISGDVYGTLPAGITLSGTGYQWTYSTTPTGTRTNITGATGATFTPNTSIAPFNTIGTYYIYRNAILSSTNNVAPNPYVATNESNAAIITTVGMPTITVTPTTLTGFSYPLGYGPSSQVISFTVAGTYLNTNITVLPTDSFDISLASGTSFAPQSIITLPVVNGAVATTTIYVRMKAGFAVGTVKSVLNPITCASTSATTKTITCTGTVTTGPVITSNPTSLSGFSYVFTSGPSAQQSFTVSGTNLIGNIITVTPSADYEISTTSGSGFVSTALTVASGTVIYVRLKSGLGVGTWVENIVLTATSANPVNITCSGTVTPESTILNTISALSGFIYTFGNGPSAEQTFTVSGSNLTANLVITPPTNFQISTGTGVSFVPTNPITLTPTSGTVNTTTIYVRMKAGLGVGSYGPENITLTSTGATAKAVSCKGSVVAATPTIATSKLTLTGFGYKQYSAGDPATGVANGGPSSEQSFLVAGTSLGSNAVTVTAPANYEISTTSGGPFQTTPITLTPSSGKVNSIIYVRLISLKPAGDYTGNITVTSSGLTITVTCVGKVFASPLITASGGGTYCPGSTINLTSTGADIQNRYWQGPNNFYSLSQNVQLTTNATTALSGTYTVIGNVIVGGNLVTNGDFEAGNTSFGSSYTYRDSTTNSTCGYGALGCEGTYSVVAIPKNAHTNFSSWPDHTPAPGKKQLVINGSPTAGVVIWSQSVPVIPGADYQFTYWEQTVVAENPSQLQLYVNGVAAGPIYTASASINSWTQFLYNASAGTNSVLNLELINQNTVANGNDFALDDIVFEQILSATASTDVTVAASVPVSVSVAASANPVTQGTTVTYTATPTNGGTTPAYAWYVNNNLVSGVTSSTYSYVPSNGDVVKCVLTSSISCATGNPATSSVTMTVNAPTNYWRGTNGTDWGTASNWTANTIPIAGANVIYASTSNSWKSDAINDLVLDQDRTIGSLINATSKRLVIPAGKSLIVNNTITTNGDNPDLIYIYSSTSGANGSLIFHNAPSSPVYGTVEMYSMAYKGTPITVPNPFPPYGTITTTYRWQYFGIPLNGVAASPTFDGSYVRKWVESGDSITNHWISVTNEFILQPFYGYELTQDASKTIVFQGQLVNWDWTSPQLAKTGTALFKGQHILANPFTAAIDIKKIVFGSDMEFSVYLYSTGSFGDWNSSTGTAGQYVVSTPGTAGSSGVEAQVPSMQAMLVQVITSSANATVTIPYNAAVKNTAKQRVKETNDSTISDKVGLRIDVAGSKSSDKMWIFSDSTCTRNFDNGWDGPKMLGSALSPQLYAIEPDGEYQIDCLADINGTQLGFQAGEDTEYTMTFTQNNLKSKYTGVYLLDQLANKTIDITESGSSYSFTAIPAPSATKRFMIVALNAKDSSDISSKIKLFSSVGTIFVYNLSELSGDIRVFDIAGHYLKKQPFSPNGIATVSGLVPGIYIAKAITNSEEVTKKMIVR